jgi:hypothetical protein
LSDDETEMLTRAVMPDAPVQTRSLALWLLQHAALIAGSSSVVRRGPLPGTGYLTPATRQQAETGVVRGAPGSGQFHDKPSKQHGTHADAAQANGLR